MPEGHTIHRLALDHTRAFGGTEIAVSSPQGRFVPGAAMVDGCRLETVQAWGKHLFYGFEQDRIVHVHLGLFGKWWVFKPPGTPTHRQVRMRLENLHHGADLTGPTACEVLEAHQADSIVARLGSDPLRADADPDRAWLKLRRRKGPIGAAIMDQSVVAGVGNVFRAEALFVQGIHPEQAANTVNEDEWSELWATLVAMLTKGVKDRRIVTVDPFELAGSIAGAGDLAGAGERRNHYVYKRPECLRCGGPIRRWDMAGRWAYACERCQPLDLSARPI